MKIQSTVLVLGLGMIGAASARAGDSFNEKCPEIAACAKVVSELTGQKYIFDADVKGREFATANLEITRENAELLFTNALHNNGYTRIPLAQPATYRILRQRDARDSALPLVRADQEHAPELPETWDLMTLVYKASHPESVEDIARLSRSFMPASSRIIPSMVSGSLLITDSAPNLKKLYEIIRDHDRKPVVAMPKAPRPAKGE